MKKPKKPKTRNPVAQALRSGHLRAQKTRNRKKYNRKDKRRTKDEDMQ